MEMCYEGALVMPQNYTMMTTDEMEYIDGGGFLYDMAVSVLGGLVACALWQYRAAIVKSLVTTVVATYNWIAAVVSSAAAWVIANPALCIGILGGVTVAVVGIVRLMYG